MGSVGGTEAGKEAERMVDWATRGDFRSARTLVADVLHRTPLLSFRTLGDAIGASAHLKCENLQKTGSFKVRGALAAVAALGDEERRRGVVTVSAGNHAQAVAWAARRRGARAVVAMPRTASRAKVEATRGYGARVARVATSRDAFREAERLADSDGLTYLHPFDDVRVAIGHGSLALEIAEDVGDGDVVVVVPVGGGGQLAGVAGALAAEGMLASQGGRMRVFGVEPTGACALRRSLDAGRPVELADTDTIADGLAPPMAGELAYRTAKAFVDDVALVSDEEILSAQRLLLTRAKLLAEPSGAAAVAALMHGRVPVPRAARAVAVVSGGNVDDDLIARALRDGAPWP